MRHRTTPPGTFIALLITIFMLSGWSGTLALATTYSTQDGLTLSENGNGRIGTLTIGSIQVLFSPRDADGGFYLRDNSPDSSTGLPNSVVNLLRCGPFTDVDPVMDCEDCLGEPSEYKPWKLVAGGVGTEVSCDSSQGSPVAEFVIGENVTEPGWGLIYQDIDLTSNEPDGHELYYLNFEMASECGWRSKTDPIDHATGKHGNHRVVAYVEWFPGFTHPDEPEDNNKDSSAIAITSLEAFNTSVELTPFALRTYRPLNANYARIKLVVEGFMPNDGKSGTSQDTNYVYIDNVAFFEAPPVEQVYAAWDDLVPQPLYDAPSGGTSLDLSMTLSVTPYDNYLLFEGELTNTSMDLDQLRALDFGFALPIYNHIGGDRQKVLWQDDNHFSIPVDEDSQSYTLPYRMVGPADLRLASRDDLVGHGGKQFEEQKYRGWGLNISAYPFSSITINRNGYSGGLGFGDNLYASHAPISHFGYRVEDPNSSRYVGNFYVEFNLGILDRQTTDSPVPFSFILFRTDDQGWTEASTFREAAEKYQTLIFPNHFTRPTNCDDDWLFGGGQFTGKIPIPGYIAGFNFHPNDFGFRYAVSNNKDTDINNAALIETIQHWDAPAEASDVDILIYSHPWAAAFRNWPDHAQPDTGIMNTYSDLLDAITDHDPKINWSLGDLWVEIYNAQKTNMLYLPGLTPHVLLTRFQLEEYEDGALHRSKYSFPVLLDDGTLGGSDLVSEEIDNIEDAYLDIGSPSGTYKGLAGIFLDNMFWGSMKGLHLDIVHDLPARHEAFVESGGALSYSLSHYKPAISQLPLNDRFLTRVNDRLEYIDNHFSYKYGEGEEAGGNIQDELLTGNMNSPEISGLKYGIIRADVSAFESSPVLAFNNGSREFDFRRTLARHGNMIRTFMNFPCIQGMRFDDDDCSDWNELWGVGAWDKMYAQIANEAIWISLAWGFHPSISSLLPEITDGDLDLPIVEEYLRPWFVGEGNAPGYTEIAKQLHLAGWQPVTNAVVIEDEPESDQPLVFVERFGPYSASGEVNGTYFTVLNNETLSFTLAQLFEQPWNTGTPSPFLFEDLPDFQALDDIDGCTPFTSCARYENVIELSREFYDSLKKNIFLEIHDPFRLGLWNGNLHGRQMVSNPEDADVYNWPEITYDEFDESAPQFNDYSIKRIFSPAGLVIGGPRPEHMPQEPIVIEDKALMVFKIWTSLIVNNGPSGGSGGERSSGSTETEDALVSSYFERYGRNWQRVETDLGYGGNVDQVQADNPLTSVFYKFTIGLGGSYRVMAHIPETEQPPAAARYEAYLLDYFEEHAGITPLGDPVWSNVIDLSGSETYNSGRDEQGFMEIGTINIDLVEPELVTVVIRLSAGEESSRYLLADAVKLVPMEGLE